ncbi:hypothetical protein F5B19DRAFT_161638 [Rostrohypoxylon terebratum]|nr:hypothetical protein F5B19DRAFT_161638 [Rostrohypoxylon terebratum]
MRLSQNDGSATEHSPLLPTGHEISYHEPRPVGILATSPRIFTRHIHWANRLQTRQTGSVVRPESLRPLALGTSDRLQPGRSSERKHATSSSRIPSSYHLSADKPSSDNSPTGASGRHMQFGSLPIPHQDRQIHRNLRRRSPSPYPRRGEAQPNKNGSGSHSRSATEKNILKSFWQQCLDFEASFLAILADAYDAKPTGDRESDPHEKEDDLGESGHNEKA